jgi:hypothetical protein
MDPSRTKFIFIVTFGLFLFAITNSAMGSTPEKITEPHRHILELDEKGHINCAPMDTDEYLNLYGAQTRRLEQTAPREEVMFATEFAQFQVTYIGFSDEARNAFQKAVEIWAETVVSDVPIRIQANWQALGEGILGQAGANFLHLLGSGSNSVWYPDALADSISGSDLAPGTPDIEATFNSAFDKWYFGLDQNPPFEEYDFVTVVLHEICHGLGFSSTLTSSNGVGSWGSSSRPGGPVFPKVYDLYLSDSDFFDYLIDKYPNNSSSLGSVITGNDMFFDDPELRVVNNERAARIYAPTEYTQGSSISHVDEFLYAPDDRDSLMTPTVFNGEVQHDPGPIVRAIFRVMGWNTIEASHYAQFAAGGGWDSDVVVQNPALNPLEGVIEIYNTNGESVDPSTVFPDLQSDGKFSLGPVGTKTFSSGNSGAQVFGTVTVKTDGSATGVIRFTFPGTGVAGVSASPVSNKVMVPVRIAGGLSSGVAIRNVESETTTVELRLLNEAGNLVDPTLGIVQEDINASAQLSKFINGAGGYFETYFAANPGDFRGSLIITTTTTARIAAVGIEFENGAKITTLPVTPLANSFQN